MGGATYTDYSEIDNSFQVIGGADYSFYPTETPLLLTGSVEAGMYRHGEYEKDDVNWITATGKMRYFIGSKAMLYFHQRFIKSDYLEGIDYSIESETFWGRGLTYTETLNRDDVMASSELGFFASILPEKMSVYVAGYYNRITSSIETETYTEIGGLGSLRYKHKLWEMMTEASVFDREYEKLPDDEDRGDRLISWSVSLMRQIKTFKLYLKATRLENDSTLYSQSFKQVVSMCGITRTFD